MSDTTKNILNGLVLVNVGWLICVMLPGMGLWWLVPILMAAIFACHFAIFGVHRWEVALMAIAGAYGFLLDTIWGISGALRFGETGALFPWLAPIWLVLLWANFATAIGRSLSFLGSMLPLSAALGAVAGPLAYFAGTRLGDISFYTEMPMLSIIALAIGWAVTMPLFFTLCKALQRRLP